MWIKIKLTYYTFDKTVAYGIKHVLHVSTRIYWQFITIKPLLLFHYFCYPFLVGWRRWRFRGRIKAIVSLLGAWLTHSCVRRWRRDRWLGGLEKKKDIVSKCRPKIEMLCMKTYDWWHRCTWTTMGKRVWTGRKSDHRGTCIRCHRCCSRTR